MLWLHDTALKATVLIQGKNKSIIGDPNGNSHVLPSVVKPLRLTRGADVTFYSDNFSPELGQAFPATPTEGKAPVHGHHILYDPVKPSMC